MDKSIMARLSDSGDVVIHYGKDGKIIRLESYREWLGPRLSPGQTVECKCEEGFIMLNCPIHAVEMGEDCDPC